MASIHDDHTSEGAGLGPHGAGLPPITPDTDRAPRLPEEKEKKEKESKAKEATADAVVRTASGAMTAPRTESAKIKKAVREYGDSDISPTEVRINNLREEIDQFRKITIYSSTTQKVAAQIKAAKIQGQIQDLKLFLSTLSRPADATTEASRYQAIHNLDLAKLTDELAKAIIKPKEASWGERFVAWFTGVPYQVRRLSNDIEKTKEEIEKTKQEYHKAMLGHSSKGDFDGTVASYEKLMNYENLTQQLGLLQAKIANIRDAKEEFSSLKGMKALDSDVRELQSALDKVKREVDNPLGVAHKNLMEGFHSISQATEGRKLGGKTEELHFIFKAHQQLKYFDQFIGAAKTGKLGGIKIAKQELEAIIQMRNKLKEALQEAENKYHFLSLTTNKKDLLEKLRAVPDPSKPEDFFIDIHTEDNFRRLVQLKDRLSLKLLIQGSSLPNHEIRQILRDIYRLSQAIEVSSKSKINSNFPKSSVDMGRSYEREAEIEFLVGSPTLSPEQVERLRELEQEVSSEERLDAIADFAKIDARKRLHDLGENLDLDVEADMQYLVDSAHILLKRLGEDYPGKIDIQSTEARNQLFHDLQEVRELLEEDLPETIAKRLEIYKGEMQAALWDTAKSDLLRGLSWTDLETQIVSMDGENFLSDLVNWDVEKGVLSPEDARNAEVLLEDLIFARQHIATPRDSVAKPNVAKRYVAEHLEAAIEKLHFMLGKPIPPGLIPDFQVLHPKASSEGLSLPGGRMKFTRSVEALAYAEVVENQLEVADRAIRALDNVPVTSGRHEHIWGNRRKAAEAIFIASEKLKQFDAWLKTLPPAMQDTIRKTVYEPKRKELEAFVTSNFHPFEVDFDPPPDEAILGALEFLPLSDNLAFPIPTIAFRKSDLDFPGRPTDSGEVLIHLVSKVRSKAEMNALLERNPKFADQMSAVLDQLEMNILSNPELAENSRLRELKMSQIYHLKRQMMEYAPKAYNEIVHAREESLIAQTYQEKCEFEEQFAYILTKIETLEKHPELVEGNPEQAAAVRSRCLAQLRILLPELIRKAPGIPALAKVEKRLKEISGERPSEAESKSKYGEEIAVKEKEKKGKEEAVASTVVRDEAYLELERTANKAVTLLNKLSSMQKENQVRLELGVGEKQLLDGQAFRRTDSVDQYQWIVKKLGARAFNTFTLDKRDMPQGFDDPLHSEEAIEQLFQFKVDIERNPALFKELNKDPVVQKIFKKLDEYVKDNGENELILNGIRSGRMTTMPHLVPHYLSILRGVIVNIDEFSRDKIIQYTPFVQAILSNEEVYSAVLADTWGRRGLDLIFKKAPHLQPPSFPLRFAIATLEGATHPDEQKKAMISAMQQFVTLHESHPREAEALREKLHDAAANKELLTLPSNWPMLKNQLISGEVTVMTPEMERGALILFFEAISNPNATSRFGHLVHLDRALANRALEGWATRNDISGSYERHLKNQPKLADAVLFGSSLELAEEELGRPEVNLNRRLLGRLAVELENNSKEAIEFFPPLGKKYAELKPQLDLYKTFSGRVPSGEEKEKLASGHRERGAVEEKERKATPLPDLTRAPGTSAEPTTEETEKLSSHSQAGAGIAPDAKEKKEEDDEWGPYTRAAPSPDQAGAGIAPDLRVSTEDEDLPKEIFGPFTPRSEERIRKGAEEMTPEEFREIEAELLEGKPKEKSKGVTFTEGQPQEGEEVHLDSALSVDLPSEQATEEAGLESLPPPVPGGSGVPTPPDEMRPKQIRGEFEAVEFPKEDKLKQGGPIHREPLPEALQATAETVEVPAEAEVVEEEVLESPPGGTERKLTASEEKPKEVMPTASEEDEKKKKLDDYLSRFGKPTNPFSSLAHRFGFSERRPPERREKSGLGDEGLFDATPPPVKRELENLLSEGSDYTGDESIPLTTPEEPMEALESRKEMLAPFKKRIEELNKKWNEAIDSGEWNEILSAGTLYKRELQEFIKLFPKTKFRADIGAELKAIDETLATSKKEEIANQYKLLNLLLESPLSSVGEELKQTPSRQIIEQRLMALGETEENIEAFSNRVTEPTKQFGKLERLLLATPFSPTKKAEIDEQIKQTEERLLKLGFWKEEIQSFKESILASKPPESRVEIEEKENEELLKKQEAIKAETEARIAKIIAEGKKRKEKYSEMEEQANMGFAEVESDRFNIERRLQREKEGLEKERKTEREVKVSTETVKRGKVASEMPKAPMAERTLSSEERAIISDAEDIMRRVDTTLEEIEKAGRGSPEADEDFNTKADLYFADAENLYGLWTRITTNKEARKDKADLASDQLAVLERSEKELTVQLNKVLSRLFKTEEIEILNEAAKIGLEMDRLFEGIAKEGRTSPEEDLHFEDNATHYLEDAKQLVDLSARIQENRLDRMGKKHLDQFNAKQLDEIEREVNTQLGKILDHTLAFLAKQGHGEKIGLILEQLQKKEIDPATFIDDLDQLIKLTQMDKKSIPEIFDEIRNEGLSNPQTDPNFNNKAEEYLIFSQALLRVLALAESDKDSLSSEELKSLEAHKKQVHDFVKGTYDRSLELLRKDLSHAKAIKEFEENTAPNRFTDINFVNVLSAMHQYFQGSEMSE